MYMFLAMNIVIMFYAIKVGVGVGCSCFMYISEDIKMNNNKR